MDAIIRRRMSAARRALDFINAHPVADTSFAAVVARLSAAVTAADTYAMQQVDGKVTEHAARVQRRTLRSAIRDQQLRRLVRVAQVAVKTHPELANQFVMPETQLPNKDFLLAARSLLVTATANQDVLVPLGLGQTFIADLTAALDQFDAATQSGHAGRSEHVGARADLGGIARESKTDIEIVGTFYRAMFPNDLDLLAAWASASAVAGPFHRAAVAPAPSPAAAT